MSDRRRIVTWEDPAAGRQPPGMTGLEYLRALQRGELPPPPMMSLMGITMRQAEEGRVIFAVQPAEYHYNPLGVVHGGLACTILDTAMGCAVHTCLPAGAGYTTLEVKVNFVRPLTVQTPHVLGIGSAVHAGRTTATAEGRLEDESGRLFAHASTTCLIFRHS